MCSLAMASLSLVGFGRATDDRWESVVSGGDRVTGLDGSRHPARIRERYRQTHNSVAPFCQKPRHAFGIQATCRFRFRTKYQHAAEAASEIEFAHVALVEHEWR